MPSLWLPGTAVEVWVAMSLTLRISSARACLRLVGSCAELRSKAGTVNEPRLRDKIGVGWLRYQESSVRLCEPRAIRGILSHCYPVYCLFSMPFRDFPCLSIPFWISQNSSGSSGQSAKACEDWGHGVLACWRGSAPASLGGALVLVWDSYGFFMWHMHGPGDHLASETERLGCEEWPGRSWHAVCWGQIAHWQHLAVQTKWGETLVSRLHMPPFQGKAASSTVKAKKVPLATSSNQVGVPLKALVLRSCATRSSL